MKLGFFDIAASIGLLLMAWGVQAQDRSGPPGDQGDLCHQDPTSCGATVQYWASWGPAPDSVICPEGSSKCLGNDTAPSPVRLECFAETFPEGSFECHVHPRGPQISYAWTGQRVVFDSKVSLEGSLVYVSCDPRANRGPATVTVTTGSPAGVSTSATISLIKCSE